MHGHMNVKFISTTRTSPDGQTHYENNHILTDRRWHSSNLDVHRTEEPTPTVITMWCLYKAGSNFR
jgi:hypothetical protein